MATNLNINKTDVYYTLINNEVYALRFKALLVSVQSLSERELDMNRDDMNNSGKVIVQGNNVKPYVLKKSKMVLFDRLTYRNSSHASIDCVIVEIAGSTMGECKWDRIWGSSVKGFNPGKIYRSVENCVKGIKPVLNQNGASHDRKLLLTTPYVVTLDDVTPENFIWEFSCTNIYGNATYQLKTWTWTGYKAEKQRVHTSCNRMGYKDSYNEPLFELLDGKFLFDDDLVEHAYATKEECYANNTVKVHLFAD